MSEEIKEILDKLNEDKDYDDYVDYKGSYFKPLLDYINNLEKRNKEIYDGFMATTKELCEYATRIEDAIEYIQNHQLVFELSSKKQVQYWFDDFYKELLKIIKGDDTN